MKLVIKNRHFQEASLILKMSTPPISRTHGGLDSVLTNMVSGRWETRATGVFVVAPRLEIVNSTTNFWLHPPTRIHGSEVIGALALTSAILPQIIAHLACITTPEDRRFPAIRRVLQMAGGLSLRQKIVKLYMIAGGHRSASRENALSCALVHWLGLESSAWGEIRTSVDTLGLTPGMCVTVARYFFENGNYEEAAALLLSEMETIAISDSAEPEFVQHALSSSSEIVSPPEIFKAAAYISSILPIMGCDIATRQSRIIGIRDLLKSNPSSPSLCLGGYVIPRASAELCLKATQSCKVPADTATNIAIRCLHKLTAASYLI